MTKVFIVILNWNRSGDTIECLRSIHEIIIRNFELNVLVVDNASSDDSIRKIKTNLPAANYRLLVNKVNLGFAGGNNVGIRYALKHGTDYVMVLNNDTRVHPDLLIRMIGVARKYPDFGAASPKIYFEKGYEFHKDKYKKSDLGNVIWYAGGDIDWDNVYGNARGVDEVDKGQYDKVEETDFATGACMFLSRKALEKVGLFDEKYFMYYEDTDLSMRLKNEGFKVVYVPQAVVWHKVAQSSRVGSNLNDYFIHRNRLLFGLRYARPRTYMALIRESIKHLAVGRKWQRLGVISYYLKNFGKGGWR